MTDMIPHHEDRQLAAPRTFLPPQDEYARVTDLATRLSGTAFVPSALQNDPPSVLAAMLTGRELGLAPMESLRSVHMIEGRPTLSAEATMKLAMEAGHLLIVTDTTRESATVKYRHAGWPDDEPARTITFDLEDAELAGLTEGRRGAMYRKYPRAMLRSRAITEAARAGGLLAGAALAYTAEELSDDDQVEEAIVVEHVGPDEEDHDELEERRQLHGRAAAAYRTLRDHDKQLAGNAWKAAAAGLGDNPWQLADLDMLRVRVADLELVAEDLEDDEEDGEGNGGPPPDPDPDDLEPGDKGAQASDPDPEPEPPAEDQDPEPDPPAEEEPDRVDGREDTGSCQVPPSLHAERLAEHYPDLTVADVGSLIRHGMFDVDLDGGRTVELVLGETPDAWRRIYRLEWKHHDPMRRTVLGALESAGYTLPDPREDKPPARDTDTSTPDEQDPPGGTVPEEVRDAQQAASGHAVGELLDRFAELLEQLPEGQVPGFRKRMGELIADQEDGVPDPDRLAALVRHAERQVDW